MGRRRFMALLSFDLSGSGGHDLTLVHLGLFGIRPAFNGVLVCIFDIAAFGGYHYVQLMASTLLNELVSHILWSIMLNVTIEFTMILSVSHSHRPPKHIGSRIWILIKSLFCRKCFIYTFSLLQWYGNKAFTQCLARRPQPLQYQHSQRPAYLLGSQLRQRRRHPPSE